MPLIEVNGFIPGDHQDVSGGLHSEFLNEFPLGLVMINARGLGEADFLVCYISFHELREEVSKLMSPTLCGVQAVMKNLFPHDVTYGKP